MSFHFVFYYVTLAIISSNISCLYITLNNRIEIVNILLNTSDANNYNLFYFYVDVKTLDAYYYPELFINTTTDLDRNPYAYVRSFSKINPRLGSNYTLQINFAPAFRPGYYGTAFHIKTYLFIYLVSKSVAVDNLIVTSQFGVTNLLLRWSQPSIPNLNISAYNIWINDASGLCVRQWFINCTDCVYNISLNQDSQSLSCINSVNFFQSNDSIISLYSNSSEIKAFTEYSVQIVAINEYGWGDVARVNVTTGQYISTTVADITYSSQYPQSPISLTWSPPLVNNGEILQYIVYITSSSGSCVVWLIMACSDRTTQNIGNVGKLNLAENCYIQLPNVLFSKASTSVSTTLSSSLILPYTTYISNVVPVNGYGWGNTASISTLTSQYIPALVRNFRCFNATETKFQCSWSEPTIPNDYWIKYSIQCQAINVIYNATVPSNVLFVSISTNVNPYTNYTCTIRAFTTSGSGQATSVTILTLFPLIPNIDNVTIANNTMYSSTIEVTATQIAIVLPYSSVTKNLGPIENVSLVVVVNGLSDVTNLRSSTEKTYAECNKGTKCPYTIGLSLPLSSTRKKRDIKNSTGIWQNVDYILGSDTSCSSGSCNGPLAQKTTYLIGFRVCSTSGCGVVKIIKSTLLDTVPIIAGTVVSFIIIFVIFVVVLILYCRLLKKKSSKASNTTDIYETDITNVQETEQYYSYIDGTLSDKTCGQNTYPHTKSDENNKQYNCWRNEADMEMPSLPTTVLHKDDIVMKGNSYRTKEEGGDNYTNVEMICAKHGNIAIDPNCQCSEIYMVTQGPIGRGFGHCGTAICDFWKVCIEYNVSIIIDLTNSLDSYKETGSMVWPLVVGHVYTHNSGNIVIYVELQTSYSNDVFEEKRFTLTMNHQMMFITQLRFKSWSEEGFPKATDFLEFYNKFNSFKENDDVVLIHRSADTEKSSTFILIDSELRKIKKSERNDISHALMNVGQNRLTNNNTEKQHIFTCKVIYQYFNKEDVFKQKYLGNSVDEPKTDNSDSYLNPCFT